MSQKYDFGLIGLGVMGRNFLLNVLDHGYSAAGLDTDQEKVDAFLEEGKGKPAFATSNIEEFVGSLSTPRKVMLLVPAGAAVDAVIKDLAPLLDKGDLIVDGGNSFFEDTDRREEALKKEGIFFFGTGVSGGAKGARRGPSIMPGGDQEAYKIVQPVFEAVSAKVGDEPCVAYMGARSAGNYVKMVHNGIEYGLMQIISEFYQLLADGFGLSNRALGYAFSEWNEGRLQSFLMEITAEIFKKKDVDGKKDLIDMILDKAKQKGTGKWTSQNAMDLGMPIPVIDAAVTMRGISSFKSARVEIARIFAEKQKGRQDSVSMEDIEKAFYFSFIITYSQGLSQLKEASDTYGYGLDLKTIARIWRGGCIIRAALLEDIMQAFEKDSGLSSLMLDSDFVQLLKDTAPSARKVLVYAIESEIPVMSLSAALAYFDAMKTDRLPSNLIQAQRDHFGSHTYERIDKEGIFHTEW
jgi:6-phosphogluconate dehydrogenase